MEPQLLTVVSKEELAKWPASEWSQWQIEAKRDGARLLIVGGVPQSRTGKPLNNIDHILKTLDHKNVVFDGELHGSTWEETMHVARASEGKRDTKLTFTIFDALSISEWLTKNCDRQLWERQRVLRHHIKETEHIKIVKPVHVDNFSQFETIHEINMEGGCDGTVLKRKDSLYEFKRTKTWLKVKPALDIDCLVVGMKEGTGKYKGMLGALEVLPDGPIKRDKGGLPITTFVSGMDDEKRRDWWVERNTSWSIVNKWIEVTYRKMNPSGRLVEPRFVRIRHDKNLT
jgi:DNA ligase-1